MTKGDLKNLVKEACREVLQEMMTSDSRTTPPNRADEKEVAELREQLQQINTSFLQMMDKNIPVGGTNAHKHPAALHESARSIPPPPSPPPGRYIPSVGNPLLSMVASAGGIPPVD